MEVNWIVREILLMNNACSLQSWYIFAYLGRKQSTRRRIQVFALKEEGEKKEIIKRNSLNISCWACAGKVGALLCCSALSLQ